MLVTKRAISPAKTRSDEVFVKPDILAVSLARLLAVLSKAAANVQCAPHVRHRIGGSGRIKGKLRCPEPD